jgi:N-acetylglucosaminyldiphosphoundecaprenol N-acetyl-beta-D-mannosaminyltransferase
MMNIPQIERVRVLGIPVDRVDMPGALAFVDSAVENGYSRSYILAVNPEKIITLQKNNGLKQTFEKASLLIPDGIGVVVAMRWLYGFSVNRVPGADLMLNICSEASKNGHKIFIFGSKENVNKEATEKLRYMYPGIQIVGRCNGYVADERMDELINNINKSEADILFIALGSPKQEEWIQKYLPKVTVKICQGIGGTLDTITGNVERAPLFMQKLGLEWLYRLIKEPKRIRRQIFLPVFVFKVLKEKFGAKV